MQNIARAIVHDVVCSHIVCNHSRFPAKELLRGCGEVNITSPLTSSGVETYRRDLAEANLASDGIERQPRLRKNAPPTVIFCRVPEVYDP